MKDRTKILLSAFSLLGWGLAATFMVSGGGPRLKLFERDGGNREVSLSRTGRVAVDQPEGPPVLELKDLSGLGLAYSDVRAVESHVEVLNAALVSLVELHNEYDASTNVAVRDSIQRKSTLFHKTADEHEEQIERMLKEEQRDGFHNLVRERERFAGLPDDAAWHAHQVRGHKKGLGGTMHDSLEIKR
jgi:hypothetical protein